MRFKQRCKILNFFFFQKSEEEAGLLALQERVQEIDDFFGDEAKGLSVDVFKGKSEALTV